MSPTPPVSNARAAVLVIDDDPIIRRLLAGVLASRGYDVAEAADGPAGLARAAARPPDLVILDFAMPGPDGVEVCRQLKAAPATRLVPVLMLTGSAGIGTRRRAWEAGADEFLPKPFCADELAVRCATLVRLKRSLEELDTAETVLVSWAAALEAKCPYTRGHSERVAAYAAALAAAAGLAAEEAEVVRRGALVHDVGKLLVPDEVLNKPGPLTDAEVDLVQRHPVVGEGMLAPLRSLRQVLPLVRWHHERPDGTGYPDGLRGDAIPPAVRALAVADVYDSLASARPYRPALPPARCLEVLREEAAAGHLDAALVARFGDLAP